MPRERGRAVLAYVTARRRNSWERTHVDNAIETHGLTKFYGESRGVVGLDLQVRHVMMVA